MRADTSEVLEALGVGLLTYALLSVAFKPAESGADQGQDRPDYAILDECDLSTLSEGNTQTVETGQGERLRLAAVQEGDDGDE